MKTASILTRNFRFRAVSRSRALLQITTNITSPNRITIHAMFSTSERLTLELSGSINREAIDLSA